MLQSRVIKVVDKLITDRDLVTKPAIKMIFLTIMKTCHMNKIARILIAKMAKMTMVNYQGIIALIAKPVAFLKRLMTSLKMTTRELDKKKIWQLL